MIASAALATSSVRLPAFTSTGVLQVTSTLRGARQNLLTRLLIKGRDEGFQSTFVALHDNEVAIEDWRNAVAHARCAQLEILFPQELSVEVVGVKTFSAKKANTYLPSVAGVDEAKLARL